MPKVVPEYKEEAKKKIIAAGREVMSKKGYHATTMEDIATYVGVSKGALYLYFGSKDELVVEIVKALPEQVHEVKMSISHTTDPIDHWIAVLDFFLSSLVLFYSWLPFLHPGPSRRMLYAFYRIGNNRASSFSFLSNSLITILIRHY